MGGDAILVNTTLLFHLKDVSTVKMRGCLSVRFVAIIDVFYLMTIYAGSVYWNPSRCFNSACACLIVQ